MHLRRLPGSARPFSVSPVRAADDSSTSHNAQPVPKPSDDKSDNSAIQNNTTQPSSTAPQQQPGAIPPVTVSEVDGPPKDDLHVLGATQTSVFFTKNMQDKFENVRQIKTEPLFTEVNPRKLKYPPTVRTTAEDDGGPIKNLLVTGLTVESMHNLQPLSDRINKNTSICLVDEGLGFAERLEEKVFTDPERRPSYILGQVDSRLMWDRDNPNRLKRLRTRLTTTVPPLGLMEDPRDVQNGMIDAFKATPAFNAVMPPYDRWLAAKLSNLVFSAVIDPVCVALDCSYNQLSQNNWGSRMVNTLLSELELVVANLPELHHSPVVRILVQGEGLRKECFGKLRNRRGATSKMVLQVRRGLPTDIDFINGYFVRRAREIGIRCPANELAVSMVKAKHYHMKRMMDMVIPFEVTSRPNYLE